MSASARVKILIAFLCAAMVVYFLILGKMGIALVQTGKPAAIGMGIGVLILPFIGLWAMIATLRAGFAHQRLAALAAEHGRDLDVSALRTTPSGRVNREDADTLFAAVKAEVEADPDDWVGWYRLARAYDYAGDRSRARETMRTAVRMQQDAAR
ncbi:cytochrome c-type biogenesis protein CcmH/NrfG [Mycobacteroides chelonae]|nr:cytochrome c-type biogenesis protein CcmH/NrfG [Mycobacteroides chelonae]